MYTGGPRRLPWHTVKDPVSGIEDTYQNGLETMIFIINHFDGPKLYTFQR